MVHDGGVNIQDAFYAAVKDTIDSLGLEVCNGSTLHFTAAPDASMCTRRFLQEDEAIESVVEEFQIQKVDMSDVVLLSDATQLNR